MNFRKAIIILVTLTFSFAFAKNETNIEGLYRKTLSNGLEVFVMENHSAPLAYIEIAVRAGAVTQTKETAGLFHLYEHLMFKGNAKYDNQEAVTQAMNKLGVGNWNGTTGVDRVNYFFTVPSNFVRDGMEFWSYAIRTPKLDEQELEREKGVVLSEINGSFTQPSKILHSAMNQALFPNEPYRLDAGGDPYVVKNATVEQMKKMQSEYYVPENAALLIGGDVNPDEIFKIAEEIFGDWKRSSNKVKIQTPPTKVPYDSDLRLVFKDPSVSGQFISVMYVLRGPDGEIESSDTYPADVWGNLVDNPDGIIAKTLTENKKLAIPDSDYTSSGYYTQRASGQISFNAFMVNNGNPVEKSLEFVNVIKSDLVKKMLDKDSGFISDLKIAKKKLENSRIYRLETATGILSELSFFFASCGANYFFNYDKNIEKVKENDIYDFIKKYIDKKNGILVVRVSSDVFDKYMINFLENDFEFINEQNAFWWKKGGE